MGRRISRLLLLFLSMLTCVPLHAQRRLREAEQAYEREQFSQAIRLYEDILERKKYGRAAAEANYKIGLCYYRLSFPEKALPYFDKAATHRSKEPLLHHYFGSCFQMLQQFDSARTHYDIFDKTNPNDDLTGIGAASLNFAIQCLSKPTAYEVEICGGINSSEPDYCPFFEAKHHKRLYFTSTRHADTQEDVNAESGRFCSNIFFTERYKDGSWSKPQIVRGTVNSEFEEGAACLNRLSNNLYYTRCKYHEQKDKGCRIFLAKKKGSRWVEVEEVPINGIPDNISIGHPAISDDELTLYFVADSLCGGLGGKDLYKVVRKRRDMPFKLPQNLGSQINTAGNEVHPYIRSNGDLYFSSDGHLGMGGLDIFMAHKARKGYVIVNMGSPINSTQDDFGIVFRRNREEGYLSSKRHGGRGNTDIYHFALPEIHFSVQGTVADFITKTPLPNTEIQIMNTDFVLIDTQTCDENGYYEIELPPDNNYVIYYKSKGYTVGKESVEVKDLQKSKNFDRDIFLKR